MATKKSNTDAKEAEVNFRYGLGIMKQNGDTAGLARAKKANPALYADWEKRQARIEANKKSGKK